MKITAYFASSAQTVALSTLENSCIYDHRWLKHLWLEDGITGVGVSMVQRTSLRMKNRAICDDHCTRFSIVFRIIDCYDVTLAAIQLRVAQIYMFSDEVRIFGGHFDW